MTEGIDMTYQGIDTAARITAEKAQILRAEGFSFAARYLVPESLWKALTKQEADDIRKAGLALMLCYEMGGEDLKGGAPQGAAQGAQARKLAEGMGVPAGTCIYFAADYDVPQADYAAIEQYMIAAQTALGSKYVAGLYGPLGIVEFLAGRGSVKRFWQCVAWSARFSEAATVRQYAWQGDARAKAVAAKLGVAVDLNETQTLTGMWGIPVPADGYDDGEGGTIIDYSGGGSGGTSTASDALAWARNVGIAIPTPASTATMADVAGLLYEYHRRFGPEDEKSLGGALSDE